MSLYPDTSPIYGQDPFLFQYDDKLMLIESFNERQILLREFVTPRKAGRTIWSSAAEHQVWAPEIYRIKDRYYIYYASGDGTNYSIRPYVLESSRDDPYSPYIQYGPLTQTWGIDMTTFYHEPTRQRYAVWSGWENNGDGFPQNLYIAKMYSPTELGPRHLLARPTLKWEQTLAPILEGPQAFQQNNTLYLFYAANASWSQEYSTGLLRLTGKNPLNAKDWKKTEKPLFTNAGHGHPHPEDPSLFICHRKLSPFPGWTDREITILPLPPLP